MSLTKEQKKGLEQLSEYFRKIEKRALKNGIDLDVFVSEYKDSGYSDYSTEKVEINEKADQRKRIFEKAGKEKPAEKTSSTKHR